MDKFRKYLNEDEKMDLNQHDRETIEGMIMSFEKFYNILKHSPKIVKNNDLKKELRKIDSEFLQTYKKLRNIIDKS